MYKEKSQLPLEEKAVTFHPSYGNADLAKKIYAVKCYKKDCTFTQTELSLLEHVSHQRISTLLKSIQKKSAGILKSNQDQLEALFPED